jgi:hypothetical protein
VTLVLQLGLGMGELPMLGAMLVIAVGAIIGDECSRRHQGYRRGII